MSRIRFRVKLNKGKHGVPLAKLEEFLASTRKFLASAARDLDLSDPDGWTAVQFRNGSLEWTNESPHDVAPPIVGMFNDAVISLSKGRPSNRFETNTISEWAGMFQGLDSHEEVGIAIYPEETGRAKWLKVIREVALLPFDTVAILPVRESIGSLQGTVHSWYRASEPPYFVLRESASRELIKCFYEEGDYGGVVEAVKSKDQVIHVHGRIYTNTASRSIQQVQADRILPAEPFTFRDFETLWNRGRPQ